MLGKIQEEGQSAGNLTSRGLGSSETTREAFILKDINFFYPGLKGL